MVEPVFDFFFEESGRGATQGAIAPAEQFFEGHVEESIVRETAQNALDAHVGDAPVLMRFELADVRTDDVPGIATLRSHISEVAAQTEGTEGHQRMARARDVSRSAAVSVLRIADFGTTGLSGSESMAHGRSPLSALTRGVGVSAVGDKSRGGSFGIGSAVGPMASDMSTVLYTSKTADGEPVFAGYSRLATHRDSDGILRVGDGFFTDINNKHDFSYLRSPEPLAPFEARTEPGTDIYVLGYREAPSDPRLENIRRAFLEHFLVAIFRGRLVVEGRTEHGEWRLDADTLGEYARELPDVLPFYRAINDPNPIVHQSKRLGKVSLFIDVDDSLEKSLYTVTMRAPLMRIAPMRHNSIPARYAAILVCDDDAGNQFLRTLEPPQHNAWDPGRAKGGTAAMKELREFVGTALRSRIHLQVGESVEIKELAKFLPSLGANVGSGDGAGRPAPAGGVEGESSTVQGAEGSRIPADVAQGPRVRVAVRTSAGSTGNEPIEKGKDAGGEGVRGGSGGGLAGEGSEGPGSARIRREDVAFRSWFDVSSRSVVLALTPKYDVEGDLELAPLGAGGAVEDGYVLPIAHVALIDMDRETPLDWDGNQISGLRLKANETTRVRLAIDHGKRYRLAVK